MKIIKPTGIIKVSPDDGLAREIFLMITGSKLTKIESREIPLRYRPSAYVNSYKHLGQYRKT